MVCVTQSYAASVLRSTSGLVHFLIGREPDPDNSEIAQLISRSIQSEQQQQQYHHQQQQQQQLMNHCENPMSMEDCVGNENDYNLNHNEHVFEPMNHHHHLSSENTTTNGNLSHLHNANNHCEDKNVYSSTTKSPPMESNIMQTVATTATATNATESHPTSSTYMQQQYLQSLRDIDVLKRHNIELQLKYSSLTDDICKMKQKSDAKIYELQKQLEDEMVSTKEKEAQIVNLEKELDQKNNLFNEFKQQYNLLEKKYLKVKKLLKESQLRETEHLEKDNYFREMADKEKQEMTTLINSLKEKIALLELKLSENVLANTIKDTTNSELASVNDKKDSSSDKSFVNVEPVSLLDVSISKQKAELVTRGSLANRQPPSLFMIRKNSTTEENNDQLDSDSGEESTIPLRSLPVKLDESFSPNVSSTSSPLRSQAKILSQAAAAAAIMTRTNSNLQNDRKIKSSTSNNNNGSYQPAFASHQQCIESPLSFHDNYNLPGSGDNSQSELTMPNIRYMSALSSPIRAANDLQSSNISSSSGSLISPVDTSNEEMLNYNELSRNNHSDDSHHHQSANFHTSDSLLSCQQNSLSSSVNTFTSTNNNLIITDWSVLDVVEFLNQLNLSTYAKRFQDENITGARFIQLDSAQLKVGFTQFKSI